MTNYASTHDGHATVSRRSFVAMAGLGLAATVLGPIAAMATGGGGSSSSGSLGGTNPDYVCTDRVWFDPVVPTRDSGVVPTQGWGDDSAYFFRDLIEGKRTDVYTPNEPVQIYQQRRDEFISVCRKAIERAVQEANEHREAGTAEITRGRVVAVCTTMTRDNSSDIDATPDMTGASTKSRSSNEWNTWSHMWTDGEAMPWSKKYLREKRDLNMAWYSWCEEFYPNQGNLAAPDSNDNPGLTADSTRQTSWRRWLVEGHQESGSSMWLTVLAVAEGWPKLPNVPVTINKTIESDEGPMNDFLAMATGTGYSVEGAEFQLFSDEACTKPAEARLDDGGKAGALITGTPTFHVGANGSAETYWVAPEKTFWLKESKAPTNGTCSLSDKVWPLVSPKEGGQKVAVPTPVTDEPILDPFTGSLHKVDAVGEDAQGSATLAGAQFEISFYAGVHTTKSELTALTPYCTATWETVEVDTDTGKRGVINWLTSKPAIGAWPFVMTDDTGAQMNYVPLGTVVLRETKAPTGYTRDERWLIRTARPGAGYKNVYEYYVDDEGRAGDNWTKVSNQETEPTVGDRAALFPLYVMKVDQSQMGAVVGDNAIRFEAHAPEGDARFEGAEFEVYNASRAYIMYGDTRVEPGAKVEGLKLVTMRHEGDFPVKGSDGTVTTKHLVAYHTQTVNLPYGEYRVVETKAPAGYTLNANPYTIPVHGQGYYTWSTPLEDKLDRPAGAGQGAWGDQVDYEAGM